jgi:SAM-dependent methyltransferase
MREMMFGTGEAFEYFRCQRCDTMQIAQLPDDIGRFYPDNYYSFTPRSRTIRERIRALVKGHQKPDWAATLPVRSSVLDIGCGGGEALYAMHDWGFRRLYGYDPYIPHDVIDGRIRVTRAEPEGQFDVVMMHHALEHMPDPVATLALVKSKMAPDGIFIVRIPVRQGAPWREYGLNWVHADPPRHLYLWTVEGFVEMAQDAGLALIDKGFDTTLFTFLGSESYVRGEPLYDKAGHWSVVEDPAQQDVWSERASALNASGDADSAWFKLRVAA